jgi:hypothetical protein
MHETKYICGIYISDIIAQKTSGTILVVLATTAVNLQIINNIKPMSKNSVRTEVVIRDENRDRMMPA